MEILLPSPPYYPSPQRRRGLWKTPMLTLLLLLLLGGNGVLSQVLPSFACWFPSYNGSARANNLVYSYNNSLGTDLIIPIVEGGNNSLTPLQFNGQQPDIFKSGYNPFTLVLTDINNVLSLLGGSVVWQLAGTTVTVTQAQIITSQRCDTAYNGVCPLWVDGFCEDDSYCDGAEGCSSLVIFGSLTTRSLGACIRPQSGILCPTGQRCSEQLLGCYTPTEAPTVEPVLEVVPIFYCWFYSPDPLLGQVINIALGYNNTSSQTLARPMTLPTNGSLANFILPADYNGLQTTLFQQGYDPLSFTLKDSRQILVGNGTIQWSLTIDTLSITLAGNIIPSTECSLLASPPDGEEIIPTEAPTSAPTALPNHCNISDTNCTAFDSFCGGPFLCNTTLQQCVPVDANYSPCTGEQFQVSADAPVVLVCVEDLELCLAYVNCSVDAECNDGLFCNGHESCLNGTCYGQVNLTIEELCGTVNAICVEGQGCVATGQTVSNQLVVAAVAGSSLVAAILLVVMCGFFASVKSGGGKSKNK
jgi:hypothetical protein